MDIITHDLTDHFSNTRFLHIARYVGHDMLVATLDAGAQTSGPLTRVYNYAGSMKHVPMYEYFSALADKYGHATDYSPEFLQFDFTSAPDDVTGAKSIDLLDTPESDVYLRLISHPHFFGVQTYATGKGNVPEQEGPVVWISKALPKVRDKAAEFEAAICRDMTLAPIPEVL